MVRRRRDGSHSPQKNKSIQNSVGNEENGYPVPDLKKTTINVTKELNDALKKKKPSRNLEEISEKFMEKILNMVNQMYKMHSRNLKTPKTKNTR
jgi:hypothetical protein